MSLCMQVHYVNTHNMMCIVCQGRHYVPRQHYTLPYSLSQKYGTDIKNMSAEKYVRGEPIFM
jgi:hypothetical protein